MPELNNRPIVKYLDPKTGGYEYATVIDVGDLQLLNTQVKSDLVQAINSLFYDDRIGGGGELTPEDLERLKNIQASIDSIKDGTFEIVNFGSINTYLNQEMNAKYEELIERLNQSNREMYDTSLINIQEAVDAATLSYEQKVAEQNALLDGAEKTLTDTKLALEETAKKLETADINYKSVKQTVDELNAYIESEIKVIDMDNFNSMVSDYKTAVQQTKDRYGIEASKQTLSYLTGQVADAQAQINVQAGEIELRAKTDQLQYIPAKKESNANPNLLFETIELLSSHWDREYGAMVTPNTFRYGKIGEFTSTNSKFTTVSDTLEIGETYTLSLYTNEQPLEKSPTDEKFAPTEDSFTPDDLTVIVDGKPVTMAIFEDLSSINGWCGVSGQFIATKENATITILSSGLEQTTHIGYISQPKLEKGLKVTPFISHIDDEIATVSTAFSLIKSQGDTILLQTQRVSQIGEENDALKETVAGIQIESNKITTAVSELEKKTDGEISRVEGKIETEANRIALDVSNKTTDEKLSALNMDTRNRIVNSDFELSEYVEKTKNWNYHGWGTIVSGIFTVLKLDNTNYLIADKTTTSSNLNNSVWMRSTPFEIQTGKTMNVQAEVFIASNPDNYQVIEIELFDDKNTLLSTVPINVSQYTSNVLRTVNVKNVPYNVFRVNFSTQIETEGVYKAQLKLGLRSGRGKVGFTKIMLNTSNMSEVDWSPAEEDNRIVQTKLESKIEILEDSITLMSEDERLDVLSGLLVQESGTFKISPQSILQEVTSAELGDSALVTKTFMNQTADGWKQGLVGKDGIIQAINASEEEYLIAFDKVRVDGLLEAKHFMGNALTLTDGFKIADKDGNAVLMANNDGQVVMNVSKLEINARPVATTDDVDERINNIALTPGPQGVSVNGVTEYYLATNASSGVTTSTPGWSTSIPAISATKQYLWNYEVTSFSNGSKSTPTTPVIIGRYGLNGNDGVSITNVVNYYALSNDKNVAPTSGWNTSPLLTSPTNRYLWNYEEIVYSNNTKTTTPKAVIGTHGESGSDGVAGKDGVGIKSTVITYGLSTSETTQPSSWSSTVPTLTKGKYLWTKTEWTYTDGSTEVGYTKSYIAKDGNTGKDGLPGKDGVGIKSTSIHYAKSTSGTSHSGATWLTTVPSVPNGQYLWTRTTWTYDDDTTETGYSVAKMGDTGPQGPQGVQGLQGPEGNQGIPGTKGADGKSSYTHIAYATGDQGQSFSHSTFPQATYIGIYVSNNQNSSSNWRDYNWTLIKGADGAKGLPGAKGADGKTPYFHTAYANSADGTVDFSITDSDKKRYIGTYTDYTEADSTDPSKYKWVDMVGSVEVGGRNLLIAKDIKYAYGTLSADTTKLLKGSLNWYIGFTPGLEPNTEYTISVGEILMNKSENVGLAIKIFDQNTSIERQSIRTSLTFTPNSNITFRTNGNIISTDKILFYVSFGSAVDFSISELKLEKGNIVTDWTPAPEDVQSSIDSKADIEAVNNLKNETIPALKDGLLNSSEKEAVKQSLNVVSADKKGIDTQYTTVYANTALTGTAKTNLNSSKVALNTAFTNLQNAINAVLGVGEGTRITNAQMTLVTTRLNEYGTALSTYNQRYEQAQDAISTEKKRLGDVYAQAQANLAETQAKAYADGKVTAEEQRAIQDAKDRLAEAKRYVDDVEIGGRNLAHSGNIRYLYGTLSSNSTKNIIGKGLWFIDIQPGFLPNTTYTISNKKIINEGSRGENLYVIIYNNEITKSVQTIGSFNSGNKTTFTTTSSVKDTDRLLIYVSDGNVSGYFEIQEFKLEKGNKATDWTPAPEDIQSSIDSKADSEATEQALNEATALLQTLQQEVRAAALDGELKDFIARYNEEQKALDEDKKESNKRLQEALNSVSLLTNNMGEMSETWNFVDRYIKNTKEGIVVGNYEEGSYILIKEDRLSFFSNNEEVAFIAQNLMEISRGAFVEQIQISQYIFEKYGTNQLAIRYAG